MSQVALRSFVSRRFALAYAVEVPGPEQPTTGLRRAEPADVERMRQWRNHPQVRSASLTTHEIGAAEHERWW
jgi:hypothetical protein